MDAICQDLDQPRVKKISPELLDKNPDFLFVKYNLS